MDWIDIREKPEKLKELLNKHGARGLAREVGVSHPTILKYKNRHGIEYNHEKAEYSFQNEPVQDQEKEPKKAGEKVGEEERKPQKIDNGDYWIIKSGDREIKITKEKYKAIRRDYCDEFGSNYLNISQITRKHNISRKNFILLKTAFNFVHNDVRYTDEEMQNNNMEKLVNQTLEQQKNQYIKKVKQKEIKQLRREVNKYRKKEYYIEQINDFVEAFFDNYDCEIPEAERREINSDYALEINIPDLHLARLCWEAEVEENYDRKKAKEIFLNTIDQILQKSNHLEFEKILLPIGNDLTNFDNIEGETTKGTFQDNDSRWQKMINTAEELLVTAIEKLRGIAPIDAFFVPGNHDFTTSYHIVRYLSGYYRKEQNVSVDHSPQIRKYRKFGINLIGYMHGDKVNKKQLYGLMQNEVPKQWADTQYREWHLGHEHQRQQEERNGVVVRKVPSIAAKSSWEFNKGYSSLPGSKGYVLSKEEGLNYIIPVDRFVKNVGT